MISSLGNVGMYFGIAGGFCFDNFGPLITAIGGALLVTVGHILAFLALQDYIKFHPWFVTCGLTMPDHAQVLVKKKGG